ncbi:23S rRNA (pseudouridine(1915)-N(3))-methyltransferase RlmH [Garciella nitratireducens]|uniref:Ribosomal RNA large subunit methyltransferase H n=1 Tax=Garciella nitratireducens DSM 15102 TaxID=1121911 RepID=A0A1T4M6Y9_9FIRM|nr:23S rRNA (pseudouridine(1915)-N(3))-methyltransferase RlmH [Garciella nitratireducens]SJZ62626.1 23S rRNA (pseudouridine1915-N3)-methyltransferase [Garciella nitratireducens DSM 15102]
MKIKVIAVGRLKENYLKEAFRYYRKKIKNHDLEIIELPDEKAPENYSKQKIEQVKKKEGKKILSHIEIHSYVFALDILGKSYTTEKLKKSIEKANNRGFREIVFIIGASNGLCLEVLQRAHERISFSPMTFPHQLMRIILVEQLANIK